ncbi:MAG: HAD family acid phosphatase [Gemmatimonadaceae bacterium]
MKRSVIVFGLLVTACAPNRATTAAPGSTATPRPSASIGRPVVGDSIPLALRWYRGSAEVQATFLQTYRSASDAAESFAASERSKLWGVIMDADETVLDNSMYQQSRGGRGYSADSWETWVKSKNAKALPGAAQFIARVHALGGKVSIVTNREENVCAETEQNLRSAGLNVDQVLCKPAGPNSDKNPRFAAVKNGIGPSKLPAMDVVMWLGDNILDFPDQSQESRKAETSEIWKFGKSWFILPNPLYGSWDKNPVP